jgi:hypothetical protein
MMPLAGGALPAYGLSVNPFTMPTLNPLISEADRKCISLVDGWKNLSAAKELIRQRAAADKAVFFVVVGASSTGRSSVANYLVQLWAQERGIDSDAVILQRRDPGQDGGVYTVETQIMEWAQALLINEDIDPEALEAPTRTRLEELSEASSIIKFGLALRDVDKDLRRPLDGNKVRYLAAILEHGKGDDLIRKVKECFKTTRAIVIVTVDKSSDSDTLLMNAGQFLMPDEGLCVNVGPIMGADVATLIHDRWEAVANGVQNPFDLTVAPEVFDSPRPITRIVRLLKEMMSTQQDLHDGQHPWPDDQRLGFGEAQMRGLLARFEELLAERRV